MSGTFVAVWPIEDHEASSREAMRTAVSELPMLAERAGVKLTGEPSVCVTEHATVGLAVIVRAAAVEVAA